MALILILKKRAFVEGSPLAIERIGYEEALERVDFTEEELLYLMKKKITLGFTRIGLITNRVSPDPITLYGFCSNDKCNNGVIYSLENESIDSVKEAVSRVDNLKIIPTVNPNLFLFETGDEYWF